MARPQAVITIFIHPGEFFAVSAPRVTPAADRSTLSVLVIAVALLVGGRENNRYVIA
jgi:hypothetical protein